MSVLNTCIPSLSAAKSRLTMADFSSVHAVTIMTHRWRTRRETQKYYNSTNYQFNQKGIIKIMCVHCTSLLPIAYNK